jgi:hypothetical protein
MKYGAIPENLFERLAMAADRVPLLDAILLPDAAASCST